MAKRVLVTAAVTVAALAAGCAADNRYRAGEPVAANASVATPVPPTTNAGAPDDVPPPASIDSAAAPTTAVNPQAALGTPEQGASFGPLAPTPLPPSDGSVARQ